MAVQWFPGGPTVFNLDRSNLLASPFPPFLAGPQAATSSTTSRYRLRWNRLNIWNDFPNQVIAHWNSVPPHDRNALVATQNELQGRWQSIAENPRILNEDDVKACIREYPLICHGHAANSHRGAPLPSDAHATFYPCGGGAGSWNLAGVPDFVLHYVNTVTALIEAKNPWLVTPQSINEVLNGFALAFSMLTNRHCSDRRRTSGSSCNGANIWLHGPQ